MDAGAVKVHLEGELLEKIRAQLRAAGLLPTEASPLLLRRMVRQDSMNMAPPTSPNMST